VELLENDQAANIERKFVNIEKYLLTTNSKFFNDNVFIKVKEIIVGLLKEVVAKIHSDGGVGYFSEGLTR